MFCIFYLTESYYSRILAKDGHNKNVFGIEVDVNGILNEYKFIKELLWEWEN